MKKININKGGFPPLTDEQKRRLETLAKQPESDIDTSDIPELSADEWNTAVKGRFCKPTKQPATVRLDSDVLAWLKSQGRGYQTRLNAILRQAMIDDMQNHHQ